MERIARTLLVLVAAATIALGVATFPAAITEPQKPPATTIGQEYGAPNRDPIFPKPLPTPLPRPGFP
jgi:hypothetical protein